MDQRPQPRTERALAEAFDIVRSRCGDAMSIRDLAPMVERNETTLYPHLTRMSLDGKLPPDIEIVNVPHKSGGVIRMRRGLRCKADAIRNNFV